MQGSSRANLLRANQTDAERLMWYRLRNRRLGGYKFRRQLPIGPYIVDFACMEQQLVVELDGGQHAEQISYDERRDEYLRHAGFRTLRFWNSDVFGNLDGVLVTILDVLKGKKPSP